MATKFKSHETRILDEAVERIFAHPIASLPAEKVEGMLAGVALALDAIGSPVVVEAHQSPPPRAMSFEAARA